MTEFQSSPAIASSPWFPCKNIGRVRIPAFGVVEIDHPEGCLLRDERRVVLRVKQPTMLGVTARTMFNGPTPIETGDTGACTDGRIVVANFHDADGTPKAGDVWGPVKDSCKVRKHVPGGRVLRSVENGQDRVILMRYEHYDIWGKLTEALDGGGTAEAKLMYADKNNSTIMQEVETSEDDPVRFDVGELTGAEFEGLDVGDVLIARYDETFGGYILRGWVC